MPNRTVRSIECHAALLGLQGKNYDAQVRANLSRSIKNSEKLKGRALSEESRKKISETKLKRHSRAQEFIDAGYTHEATKNDLVEYYNSLIK